MWHQRQDDPMPNLEAALRRLPTGAAFSGLTAVWFHRIGVAPCDPIDMTLAKGAGVSGRVGIALHRSALPKGDVVLIRGMPVTSLPRTICDLCGRLSLTEAVVIADAALHAGRITFDQLSSWAKLNPRRHGIRNLRRLLTLVEPAAASPMESRLRMVLVLAGLPRPLAQVEIHDDAGRFAGRPDLYYEEERLGIEYDGGTHRDSMAEDNRRQNRLLNAGVRLLRFSAGDVLGNPDYVVNQVRGMLATR